MFEARVAGRRKRMSRLQAGKTPVAAAFAFTAVLAGCGENSSAVSAEAAPIVDRLVESPSPVRWDFVYQLDSASPYFDCLDGFDAVTGSIDASIGVLRLAPDRIAPPLIVTDESLLVGQTDESDSWLELRLDPDLDQSSLTDIFGEVLTGYILAGVDTPDPRSTVLASIDIAASVNTVPSPLGLSGDAIEIQLDPDRYLDELTAGGVDVTDEDRDRIPTITATVGAQGRITGLVVDPDATSEATIDEEHRDRYVIIASYDDLEPLSVPAADNRAIVDADDIDYPSPDESCAF